MNRHLPLAYVLSVLESLAGILLILGSLLLGEAVFRDPRHARFDDWLALAGLATAGLGVTGSGASLLFHRLLPYHTLRRVRMVAVLAEACLVIAGVGLVWILAPSLPWLGRLPGDIRIEGKNFRFYFPLVTCLLFSLALSLVLWLIRLFRE